MQSVNTTIAVCGRGLIADAAAAALQDFAAVKRVTAEMLPVPGTWDGLVVASDCWDLGAHAAAHQACQARRIPWMPIHTELSTALIGPLTRPARPGCPVCFDLRREHNSPANQARSAIQGANVAALAAIPSAMVDRLAASLIGTRCATGSGGTP
jgi:hypothetical protein